MDRSENIIVFDWNGTLLADTRACLHALNKVLTMMEVPHTSIQKFRHHYTMPLDRMYHALGCDPETLTTRESHIHPIWHATYEAAPLRLRHGAKPMFRNLQNTGSHSIVLSNYMTHKIEAQAQQVGVRHHFNDILAFAAADDTFRRRGKGERLKDYLQERSVGKVIIIGDSEEEIDIGHELGLTSIAVRDGACSTRRLRAMKPDYMVRNLSAIPALVRRVFNTVEGKR
jgi:phosphoglycolate phosphatase-like HAD superfamily hydrolase